MYKDKNVEEISDYLEKYNEYSKYCSVFGERKPNFPECISENIVRLFIIHKIGYECTRNTKSGDLVLREDEKVEVKCFSSKGPTSFGPTEKWKYLYFVDATKCSNGYFKIYLINMNNIDFANKVALNKKGDLFIDQCLSGRRPRISFTELAKQKENIPIKLVFSGNLNELRKQIV